MLREARIMNMPAPPGTILYSSHNKSLLKTVKEVSYETMSDAAKEITELKRSDADEIVVESPVMGHGSAEVTSPGMDVSQRSRWILVKLLMSNHVAKCVRHVKT